MPRMQLSVIHSLVEDLTSIKDKDTLLKHSIQRGLDMWAESWNWIYLTEDAFITTVAPNTTGTASITNDSATVTGSGTSWTSAMVGRKIRFNGENAYYRIKTVGSTTSITLETVYQGTTDTTATLSIYKDEYRLPSDLARYKLPRQIENGIAITDIDSSLFHLADPQTIASGDPSVWALIGSNNDSYSTGTLSGSAGASVLTGSSTVWTTVDGLGRGSRITVGDLVYTVKSVDNDSQLTIYEVLSAAISGGTAYTILLDNYRIIMSGIPDSVQNVYFDYQRVPAPLVNDKDIPDMPSQWQWFLVEAAKLWMWETKDKAQSAFTQETLDKWLKAMKKSDASISTTKTYPRMPFTSGSGKYQPPMPGNYGIPFRGVRNV